MKPDGKLLTLFGVLVLLGGAVTLTAYSATLYKLFCRVTGYGGTVQVADSAPGPVLDRTMVIRFNADVNAGLPWRFEPTQRKMTVRVGEPALAFYRARSLADRPIVGNAVFNVTPAKAGLYFTKTACFCFTEQRLDPGQVADMPVQFYVDPSIAEDHRLDDVRTITLSYTFFKAENQDAAEKPRPRAALSVAGARKPGTIN